MVHIILASASLDRQRCFERIGIPITVIPSNFDERSIEPQEPAQYVQTLAFKKARMVCTKWNTVYATRFGPAVVIGADTMAYFQNTMLGKASSIHNAHEILTQLMGKRHQLYTGVCIIPTDSPNPMTFYDSATVHFQSLSSDDIWNYLRETDEYEGRAGAYSLFDRANLFIDHIEGSPTNVLGLPMAKLRLKLLDLGINLLQPSSFIRLGEILD
ncbi:MAG: Maf family protein [Promethearchaeota archaeon]